MSATWSRSASRGSANSGRKSSRLEIRRAECIANLVIARSASDEAIHPSFAALWIASPLALLAMTEKKGIPNETRILPGFAIRAKGAHCRDRTRPDRQNRTDPDYPGAGPTQR